MDYTSSSRMMSVLWILMSILVSKAFSIRVDFNTNTGPIRPPTTTPVPPPQPPFRAPAPVWEDQSNDIPNPNVYRYVPPPPSRPRYDNNDIETNQISDDKAINNGFKDNARGFFVDVPPKFYKSSAKQQFYQQQYLNDVFSKNYYSKSNKFSIIAFKDKYRGLPYYVFYFARVPSQKPIPNSFN